jgi:predicted hotdog family 3-hydroxylacyl-ACP dehydratase
MDAAAPSIAPRPPVEHFVPHRGAMSLLSRLVTIDAEQALAEVDITPTSMFVQGQGVPAWVGIEYMAQTIAAWAGARSRAAGGEPAIGFLLGSRRYQAEVPVFATGQTLRIHARCELIGDSGLGQFACRIHDPAHRLLAEAMVSVFEPPMPPSSATSDSREA